MDRPTRIFDLLTATNQNEAYRSGISEDIGELRCEQFVVYQRLMVAMRRLLGHMLCLLAA